MFVETQKFKDFLTVKETDGTYGLFVPESNMYLSRFNTLETMVKRGWWNTNYEAGESKKTVKLRLMYPSEETRYNKEQDAD